MKRATIAIFDMASASSKALANQRAGAERGARRLAVGAVKVVGLPVLEEDRVAGVGAAWVPVAPVVALAVDRVGAGTFRCSTVLS